MKRVLPAIAAFALVIAGVGAAIVLLASRDHSSIEPAAQTSPSSTTAARRVDHLPAGNVVVEFSKRSDGIRVDQLAEQLGAIDTKETRATGQALVSKKGSATGVVARSVNGDLALDDATDPRLAAFVRQNLGRTTP